ncbi:hypothetical protein NSK_000461 [Nannochloropsis salina CCMP1776]|uniref:Uncharacterized protein n=1 Tax=Nannochloropsis salina CCMP1776 TaxID=1027361 RepID=A0A4D9DCH0_9STRA|nr:hypothetical protein NSK_000461 [Nannochloropsis salina CCMP1776]|eukprot:TFJ88107.1 hypothetical protein NSK_000461 [Nannochloropsis salina CCMP1776]
MQLESNGWEVYSCDLSHDESLGVMGRHLQSNFDHRRFQEAFTRRFPHGLEIRQVIFDYFYIPEHWASQRWGSGRLVTDTIPFLRRTARVREFWLPNCKVMRELLEEHEELLVSEGLDWSLVRERWKNVLYVATEQVDRIMQRSLAEVKTNANQVAAYLDDQYPFIKISPIVLAKSRRSRQEKRRDLKDNQKRSKGVEGGLKVRYQKGAERNILAQRNQGCTFEGDEHPVSR